MKGSGLLWAWPPPSRKFWKGGLALSGLLGLAATALGRNHLLAASPLRRYLNAGAGACDGVPEKMQKHNLILRLTRAVESQNAKAIGYLIEAYDKQFGGKHGKPLTTEESRLVFRARSFIGQRFSWVHRLSQLRTFLSAIGQGLFKRAGNRDESAAPFHAHAAIGWICAGVVSSTLSGWWNRLFYHFFALMQTHGLRGNVKGALNSAAALIVQQITFHILERIGAECVARGGKAMRREIQRKIFEKLLTAPTVFHDRAPQGFVAQLLRDASELESGLVEAPVEIARQLGILIPSVVACCSRLSVKTLILLIGIGSATAAAASQAGFEEARARRMLRALEAARASENEKVLGTHLKTVVRAFGDEHHEMKKFETFLSDQERLERNVLAATMLGDGATVLNQIGRVGTFILLAAMIKDGSLKPSEFLGFADQITLCWTNLKGVYDAIGRLLKVAEPAERVLDALSLECERVHKGGVAGKDRAGGVSLCENNHSAVVDKETASGDIVFEDVSFQYPLRDTSMQPTLRGLSFTIKAGSVTALVGVSGSGKSTALALLAKLYAPSGGRIKAGGVSIHDLPLWRRHVALVSQEPRMFPGRSIRSNVMAGARNGCVRDVAGNNNACGTDDYQIVKDALCGADALEFVEELPRGMDTLVGGGDGQDRVDREESSKVALAYASGGASCVGLSGGQAARLAIARALARNAPILLLDEAFANLDTESEARVISRLTQPTHGTKKTIVVVSHQLMGLSWVDQVVVMRHGLVVEVGRYEDLAAKTGAEAVFANMLRTQSDGVTEAVI